MYKETSLLMTKLNIPTVSSKLIKRPNLFKKLDEYLKYKLILINAPAGYGKTALITSWLYQKQKEKAITTWLSLDEEDNDPEVFWSYFLSSFYINVKKENNLNSYEWPEKFNRLQIVNLINNISNLNMDVLMVIEDFYVITDYDIIKNLKYLIKNMPPNMHILISTRNFIDLGLAKLRISESFLEINESDLIFSLQETDQFFKKVMNISLSEEKCKLINSETEGWIAAIQILGLVMKNSDEDRIEKHIHGNQNFVFDYIAEEIFLKLREEIKDFLMYTSIFNQFSSEISNYVLGISNSEEIIKEILALNLFIIRLDNEEEWFRYQNLFRSFLKKHLNNLEIERIRDLYNKMGQWYELKNQINIAIENYIKANNFEKTDLLIEQVSGEILCRGEARILDRWNKRLPEFIVNRNPRLILNSAWGAATDGNKEEVNKYINTIEGLKCFNSNMKAEIIALRSSNLIGEDDILDIIEECKNTLQNIEPKEFLAQLIHLNIAIGYLSKGKLNEARFHFEKCCSIGLETNQWYIVIVASKALASSMRLRGEYSKLKKQNEKLISNLVTKRKVFIPTVGLLYGQLAEAYNEWNEFEKALEYAQRGLELGLDGEDFWTISENYLTLAKIYSAMGLEENAMTFIEKAEETIEEKDLFDVRLRLECFKAEIMLRKEYEKPISKWLEAIMSQKNPSFASVYPEIFLVKIRDYINKNMLTEAKEILTMLGICAEENELEGLLIQVKILSSIIFSILKNHAEALEELSYAIDLSLNEKPLQVFLNEGNLMKDLLEKFKRKLIEDNSDEKKVYIDKIINKFKPKSKNKLVKTSLKTREIEVLILMQEGASNSEIAEELFISINTVKTHILNIYAKLDVHNRTKAVAKAKELNLI